MMFILEDQVNGGTLFRLEGTEREKKYLRSTLNTYGPQVYQLIPSEEKLSGVGVPLSPATEIS